MAIKGSSKYNSRVILDNGSIVYFNEWDGDRDHRIRAKCGKCGQDRLLTYAGAVDIVRKRVSGQCRRCDNHAHAERQLREGNSYWRGGRRVNWHGYVEIRMSNLSAKERILTASMATKDCYILEHRLVMSRKLDRALETTELVHHLNGIKDDNRPENLLLVTSSTHSQVAFEECDKEIIRLRSILDKHGIEY